MATITIGEEKAKANPHRVLALYKFVAKKQPRESLEVLKEELLTKCQEHHAKGTLLLAEEGINGTICYPFPQNIQHNESNVGDTDVTGDEHSNNKNENNKGTTTSPVDTLLQYIQEKFGNEHDNHHTNDDDDCSSNKNVGLRIRIAHANFCIFPRMKVKFKSEIVTMHQDDCDPTKQKGIYVSPKQWNDLLKDPECLVVDTRNEYEIHVGTFQNAVNPHLQNFVEFNDWMKQHLQPNQAQNHDNNKYNANDPDTLSSSSSSSQQSLSRTVPPKKIAMFCTGGIRCEKATNACQKLVPPDVQVYHLEGGILAYLDEISPQESMFEGECYVFDQRVAVTYGNEPSTTFVDSCKACRHPLSKKDMDSEMGYVEGLSCRFCVDRLTEKQKERFQSRQRQVELAREWGVEEFFDPAQMNKKRNRK